MNFHSYNQATIFSKMDEYTHIGPALCVKFHKDSLLTCYGPYLQEYDYKHNELMNKCKLFNRNKIHGICISSEGKICAYGGSSISILKLEDINQRREYLSNELVLDENITAIEFSKDGSKLYILTNYNKVLITDLTGKVVEEKKLVGERSILYSGSIKVISESEVQINAGTVMGGAIVWDLYKEELIHNLTGHEGSIFYIQSSEHNKLIASCSDDRSIRLWDRETGKELSIGWSHTARIWNLKFFNNDENLVSVSEDCTCRVWNIIPNDISGYELQISNIFEGHLLKNVWGVDVNDEKRIIATSGNDGRINVIDLNTDTNSGDEVIGYEIADIEKAAGISFEKDEIIKGFYWFKFGLVCITSQGRVLAFQTETKQWRQCLLDSRFASYSITNGIYESNIVFFTNNKCDILAMKFSIDGSEVKVTKQYKEDSLSKLSNSLAISAGYHILLLESPNPTDKLCFWSFDDNLEIKKREAFEKPANIVSSCFEIYDSYYLVGSRFSSIAVFDTKKENNNSTVLKNLTSGDTITSIQLSDLGPMFEPIFAITNRDGYYKFIKCDFKNLGNDGFYEVLHSNKITKGFLEGSYLDSRLNFITYGFKSSLFYIYDETECLEIASEVCGGAHRQWHFCKENVEDLVLTYIKASKLFIRHFKKSIYPHVLEPGLHGREIRDVTIMPDNKDFKGYFFCTGSEDTTIKLSYYDPNSRKIKTYWTERRHVSGLQKCRAISNSMVISSSAREELFLWKVNYNRIRPYMMCKQVLPTSNDNPDLRIMDFSVSFVNSNEQDFLLSTVYSDSMIKLWYYSSEANTFTLLVSGLYKTCCLLGTELLTVKDNLLLLASATDGHLFGYNVTDQVLKAGFSIENNKIYMKSSLNTDSSVSLSNERIFDVIAHQSGIKTMTLLQESDKKFRIFTGGDDNALALTSVQCNPDMSFVAAVKSTIAKAAASTITGTALCSIDNHERLVSCSVDQIVRVWSFECDELKLESEKYTTIADTGCIDTIEDKEGKANIVIGGVGLSILAI